MSSIAAGGSDLPSPSSAVSSATAPEAGVGEPLQGFCAEQPAQPQPTSSTKDLAQPQHRDVLQKQCQFSECWCQRAPLALSPLERSEGGLPAKGKDCLICL